MRALVTGATGFLGQHLTRHLLRGGAQVRILARSPERARELVEEGARLFAGDVTDAGAALWAAATVDVVYHLAGKLFDPATPEAVYEDTHVHGTDTLLRACLSQSRPPRFVHCSTTGVLGVTGERPAGEDTAARPTNAYERTKWEAEGLVRRAAAEGLPTVIMRPGLVYGPGDLHLLGFFRAIQRGWFRPIGRRPVWLHPVYIDDLTEAIVRAGDAPSASGACLHLAGLEPVSVGGLAEAIASALNVPAPAGSLPFTLAWLIALAGDCLPARARRLAPLTRSRLDFLTHSRVYDISRASAVLGYSPAVDLRQGLRRTVAWYRHHGYLPQARFGPTPAVA